MELDGGAGPAPGFGPDRLGADLPAGGLRDAWQEEAAVRALGRALAAVTAARRRLAPAEDVDWAGGPAERYRCELEELVDRLRGAQAQADAALRACEQHAASVRRHADVTLAAPPPAWATGPVTARRHARVPGPWDT